MPLGTLDRTPPPFFRQGPSALTKLVFCSALAIFLMASDNRFALTPPLRATIATVLHPVERVLMVPVGIVQGAVKYAHGLQQAVSGEARARAALAELAERATRAEVLAQENSQLRELLGLRERLWVRSQAAEVMYEARDPFSRKIMIDRGQAQGIEPGSPVIDGAGVLGQVTRVYPLSSEVTLLTDKDAAIPLLNTRTRQRGAAYGANAGAGMELRFMPGNVDIKEGDLLTTSGVDGVYPPGLPVATVVSVERRAEGGFARIGLAPLTTSDGVRHVLVLEPVGLQMPPPPAAAPDGPTLLDKSDATPPPTAASGASAPAGRSGAGAAAAAAAATAAAAAATAGAGPAAPAASAPATPASAARAGPGATGRFGRPRRGPRAAPGGLGGPADRPRAAASAPRPRPAASAATGARP